MPEVAKNKVNRTELALVFGVAATTVDAWVKAGCPFVQRATGRGKGWVFDTADVSRWREQRAADEAAGAEVADEAALTRRKKMAETRLAELELAQAAGAVAPVADMERAWSRVMAELQSSLRGAFVARCARQLLGETDERTFKRVLLSEVDSSLECLADMEVDTDSESEDDAPADG